MVRVWVLVLVFGRVADAFVDMEAGEGNAEEIAVDGKVVVRMIGIVVVVVVAAVDNDIAKVGIQRVEFRRVAVTFFNDFLGFFVCFLD